MGTCLNALGSNARVRTGAIAVTLMLLGPALLAALQKPYAVLRHAASSFALGNRSSTILALNPAWSPIVLIAYAIDGDGLNGPTGSVQPGVAALDIRSGAFFDAHQVNIPPHGHFDVVTHNAGHDAPVLVSLGNGDVLEAYGASSTYWRYHPPQAWACLGKDLYCMPFKMVTTIHKNAADIITMFQSSREFYLPSIGLSEGSFANGDAVTIFAGSEQVASPWGQAGSFGYVAYHPVSSGEGYFDTMTGPWDFHQPLDSASPGLQTLTRLPQDNAYFEFTIQIMNPAGPSSITLSLDGSTCVVRLDVTGLNSDAIVDQLVDQFNFGPQPGCMAERNRYRAVAVSYRTLSSSEGTVGIEVRSGDAHLLPAPPSGTGLRCSGGIVCGDAIDLRSPGVGGHVHFLFGGVFRLGQYFYAIMDIQQTTRSWYGAGHNSLGLAIACFRSVGPQNSVWTWTDCVGAHPFIVSPGKKPGFRLGSGAADGNTPGSPYLVGPPVAGYPKDMIPFTFDYSMEAQPQYTAFRGGPRFWPVVSAIAAVTDDEGNLWLAYQCFDSSGRIAVCYLEMDGRTGKTEHIGFIDKSSSKRISLGTLEFLRRTDKGLVLGFLVGNGEGWGCRTGPCAIVYRTDPRSLSWTKEIVQSFGGQGYASATGTVGQDYYATHLLFQTYRNTGESELAVYSYAP
jgi:hypothetical protein